MITCGPVFFSHSEADKLLEALVVKSQLVHDMVLLSINTGMRAGKIFSLIWADVDMIHGLITLRNTKSGRTRTLNMTRAVEDIFQTMEQGQKGGLVFPNSKGGKRGQMSQTFNRTVDRLGFNKGVEDSRQKVCFHTCRHSFASWLVQAGVPLYQVKELMGHSTIAMTERFAVD